MTSMRGFTHGADLTYTRYNSDPLGREKSALSLLLLLQLLVLVNDVLVLPVLNFTC